MANINNSFHGHNYSLKIPSTTVGDPKLVIGANREILLKNNKILPITCLNNAATTPIFSYTLSEINNFYTTYGALHRGAGPNAKTTCELIENAISDIKNFIGSPEDHVLLFTTNTSEAVNLAARLLRERTKGRYIITSDIEHTSNNLPWRMHSDAKILEIPSDENGIFDYQYFEKVVNRLGNQISLVTLTGASNLTGFIPNIKKISKIIEGKRILLAIDGAQLVPHRPISIKDSGIDMLVFCSHKIYAPLGIGVLSISKKLIDVMPSNPGGGSIDMYNSAGDIIWSPKEKRHQVGTINAAGIFALAKSIQQIKTLDWQNIIFHERYLMELLLDKLRNIPNLIIHGDAISLNDRTSVLPFTIKNQHHALTAAILEEEYGIEVRAGTICNHRLVRRWFKINDTEQFKIEKEIRDGNRLASYGVVRASLGAYNSEQDILRLVDALLSIVQKGPSLKYRAIPSEERYESEKGNHQTPT